MSIVAGVESIDTQSLASPSNSTYSKPVWAGFEQADPIAGLAISIAIVAVLRGAALQIYFRLMDAVDPKIVEHIRDEASRTAETQHTYPGGSEKASLSHGVRAIMRSIPWTYASSSRTNSGSAREIRSCSSLMWPWYSCPVIGPGTDIFWVIEAARLSTSSE